MIKDKKSSQDLARKTELRRKLRRMGRGARKVKPGGGKGPMLALMLLLLCMGWLYHGLVGGLMMGGLLGRLYGIATGLVAVALAVGLTLALLWAWGGPLQARYIEENLARIGFANANGEVPELLSITRHSDNPKIKVYGFEACGIPVLDWLDFAEKIQSALNVNIVDVQYGEDNQHIKLTVAPPMSNLPKKVHWHDRRLPLEPYTISVGESTVGPVLLDLRNQHCHMLISGVTGSGKSSLLKVILYQCIAWNMVLYLTDFKGGVSFGRWWESRSHMCTSMEDLITMLEEIVAELHKRMKLFYDAGVDNIEDYNKAHATGRLRHLVWACDEAVDIFDKTGATKARKAQIEQVDSLVSEIAQKGRFAGCHAILSGQRLDAATVPPQVRTNLSCRICGRADEILSNIVLDSRAAADLIPSDAPGRFVLGNGANSYTVFQSYKFDERRQ